MKRIHKHIVLAVFYLQFSCYFFHFYLLFQKPASATTVYHNLSRKAIFGLRIKISDIFAGAKKKTGKLLAFQLLL